MSCLFYQPLALKAFLQSGITDFHTLSYTSTILIPTFAQKQEAWKRYPSRTEPPRSPPSLPLRSSWIAQLWKPSTFGIVYTGSLVNSRSANGLSDWRSRFKAYFPVQSRKEHLCDLSRSKLVVQLDSSTERPRAPSTSANAECTSFACFPRFVFICPLNDIQYLKWIITFNYLP